MKLFRSNYLKPVLTGFALLISLFIFSAFIYFYEIESLGELTTTIYKHPLEVSNASLKASMGVVRIHRTMKDVVLSENKNQLKLYSAKVDEEEKEVFNNLDIVKINILGKEGQELENVTRKYFTDWKKIRDEVISLVMDGQKIKAARITTGKGADHVLLLEEKMKSLTSYARNKADNFMGQALNVKKRAVFSTVIISIFELTLSIAIVLYIIKQISYSFNLVREANTGLKKEKEFAQNAIDSQRDTFVVFDPEDGKFLRWNKSFEDITGCSHDDVVNKKFPDDFFSGTDLEQAYKALKKTIDEGNSTFEIYLTGKKGKIPKEYITSVLVGDGYDKKYIIAVGRDISERKINEAEREKYISELKSALEEIKTLKGIIPICSYCKQIRNDQGFWQQVEQYVHEHTEAMFSHGVCPECEKKLYEELE